MNNVKNGHGLADAANNPTSLNSLDKLLHFRNHAGVSDEGADDRPRRLIKGGSWASTLKSGI